MKKNKKALIALAAVVVVGGIGSTLAYFTNSETISNIFSTRTYSSQVKEVFTSPDDWTPGDVTTKQVSVTNNGEVDMAVRVSYTEKWTSANNDNLPLKQGDNTAAIIGFNDDGKWVKEGNYYYYNEILSNGEETSNFIEDVTFNPEITSDFDCTESEDGGATVTTCTSTGDGYDGATYQLDITVETVQANAYKDVWGTSLEIS